jgi:membrane protease YdiL (CAAX protease family)
VSHIDPDSFPERLRLPGPRALWWVVGIVPVVVVGAVIASASLQSAPGLEVGLELRYRTLFWRVSEYYGGPAAAGKDEERLGRTAALPDSATATAEALTITPTDADARVLPPPTVSRAADVRRAAREKEAEDLMRQLQQESEHANAETLRDLFRRAQELPPAPPSRYSRAATDFPQAVVAHMLAVQEDALALEFAARLPAPSRDLLAAFAAVPADVTPTAVSTGTPPRVPALPIAQAVRQARERGFGRDWSPYTRQLIRARILAASGDYSAARAVHREIRAQDERVVPLMMAIGGLMALALFMAMVLAIYASIRGQLAKVKGEPPWRWLLQRYPGLPDDKPYLSDPLVMLLGLAGWLTGYLGLGLLSAALPGERPAYGLTTLMQTFGGILLAQAVIQAFGRTHTTLHTAARLGGPDAPPFLRATTAALRMYCLLLPVVFLATILNAMIFQGGPPHAVAGYLLEEPDPLQLGTLALGAVIAAPLGEELFFRGFLYRAMRQRWGVRWALLATSVLFAFIHASPSAFLPYAALGLAFGLVYEWVGSLWASITLHALWNLVVLSVAIAAALS